MNDYDPRNWYWIVGGDESRVFSSAARGYVAADDPAYAVWLASGSRPTRILNQGELWDVLRRQAPELLPPDNYKPMIRRRADKLEAGGDAIGALKLRLSIGDI